MKPIRIDFAPRTGKRAILRTRALTWALAGAGLALCASAAVRVDDLGRQRSALEAGARRERAKLAERGVATPAPKKLAIPQAQANAVNSAILQLNLPWREVLNALAASTPAAIALLSIEPDAKKHLVRGLAEAKTSDDMIAYIEQLKQQPFFDDVVLTRHEINEQDSHKPLRFQFEANWAAGPK